MTMYKIFDFYKVLRILELESDSYL